jgi:hypothetical protein
MDKERSILFLLTKRAPRTLAVAGVTALSLLASACGGSTSPKVAQVGTATSTTASSSGPTAFSACMRSHGLPNFPDPDSNGRFGAVGIYKGSPAFRAANSACRALNPKGPVNGQTRTQLEQQLPQLLAFAKCMRAHGVAKFGDPEISPSGHSIAYPVVDTHSPAYAAAWAACRGKLSRDQSSQLFSLLGGGKQAAAPQGGK